MLQKFIWWTGLSDFLVGAGTWFGAVTIAMAAEPVKGQFVPLITLGTFLMMAAALLMWSSHDMANRAPDRDKYPRLTLVRIKRRHPSPPVVADPRGGPPNPSVRTAVR